MKTIQETFEERIKENMVHCIDPFEVYKRMKKAALETFEIHASQFQQNKDIELPSDEEIRDYCYQYYLDNGAYPNCHNSALWMREEIRKRLK